MSDEDKKTEETAAADTEGTEESAAAAAATAAPAEEEKNATTEEVAPAAADTEAAPAEKEEAAVEEAPADDAAAAEPKSSPDGTQDNRPLRKTRVGVVIADKMDKTIVINVVRRVAHPRFKKIIKQSTKLYAHDEEEAAKVGDKVRVMEVRPLSKRKRWRLVEVLSH